MAENSTLPKLITFDGEARTGKGTIVKRTKLALEAEGFRVKHIDGGQIFRALAVIAYKLDTDFDDPTAVDSFLEASDTKDNAVELLNRTGQMSDDDREAVLYTPEVSERCAKVGARALSQAIAQSLAKQWVASAKNDSDVVLLDGRVLEHLGREYDAEGLVQYCLGLYLTCDERVGAKRYLGLYLIEDEDLTPEQNKQLDDMVLQIRERNKRDAERAVEPLRRPDVKPILLPDAPVFNTETLPTIAMIDTSAFMTKDAMSQPIVTAITERIKRC